MFQLSEPGRIRCIQSIAESGIVIVGHPEKKSVQSFVKNRHPVDNLSNVSCLYLGNFLGSFNKISYQIFLPERNDDPLTGDKIFIQVLDAPVGVQFSSGIGNSDIYKSFVHLIKKAGLLSLPEIKLNSDFSLQAP